MALSQLLAVDMPYNAKRLRTALALSDRPADSFLELARCLAEGHSEDPTFLADYIRVSRMWRRKAYYLLELGKRLDGLGISDKRLQRIGWTKLQIIAKRLTRENAQELLTQAEENTAVRLNGLMRGQRRTNRLHCVQLYFTPKQYRQLEQAILQHGGKRSGRGLVDKEEAILRMVKHVSDVGLGQDRTMLRSSSRTIAEPKTARQR